MLPLLLCGALPLLGACSSPATGHDSYSTGAKRVVELAYEAANAAATGASIDQPATGAVTCRRHVLGYAVGATGTHRVESAISLQLTESPDPKVVLDRVREAWQSHGYDITSSSTGDPRFPKVAARAPGGYSVVTTVLPATKQVEVYTVSPCLRGRVT